jgi:hypothetical protein
MNRSDKMLADVICKSIAKGLREYGYPDTSPAMINEILVEYRTGKRDLELPHGVIGAFASSQLDELYDQAEEAKEAQIMKVLRSTT